MKNCEVTVVVPFYNRSIFLERLLDSISNQDYGVGRVLIIDNGSVPEESSEAWRIICRHEMQQRCEFISTLQTGNANVARNLGFLLANSEYVAFLDSDDWWGPKHLRHSIDLLKRSDKAGVYSGANVITKHGRSRIKSKDVNHYENAIQFLFQGGGMAQSSSFVVSKSMVTNLACWDEKLKRSQDHDYFVCIQENTSGWVYNEKPDYYIDWRTGGAIGTIDVQSILRFFQKWEYLFGRKQKIRFFIKYMLVCKKRGMVKDFYKFQECYRYFFGRSFFHKLLSSDFFIYFTLLLIELKLSFKMLQSWLSRY